MKRNKAENKVREILLNQGFDLSEQKDERHSGVDIVAMKYGKVFLIEVKKANYHNRAWQVDSVSRKQREVCDTIAIVTPKGTIIQPMKEHLKLCSKNGMRYITEMVNIMNVYYA
jgi:Holliday junction resolvase-like predicted endonuclease